MENEMAAKPKNIERLAARASLLFEWRQPSSPLFSKLAALGIVGGIFALLLANLQVHVLTPGAVTGQSASLMLMPTAATSGEWLSKAREGGPFPSRFEPLEWESASSLEGDVMASLLRPATTYSPVLRELPANEPAPAVPLANKGERVFPPVVKIRRTPVIPSSTGMMPGLYPLSGVTAAELPEKIPPLSGEITAAMAATPWRFLIRLLPGGGVADCTSLAGSEEPGANEIEAWLRQMTFDPATYKRSPWITVAVYFTNQPADGTDAR
jgi:hypothetical protein